MKNSDFTAAENRLISITGYRFLYTGWISALLILCTLAFAVIQAAQPTYLDATADTEQRVEDLLERMTHEEKIGQLSKPTDVREEYKDAIREGLITGLYVSDPAVSNEYQRVAVEESRLGIPLLFATDVIHGFRTVFPIPLGLAATWNPGLVEQCAAVAASEAAAHGIRQTYSPMVDVARDPRWGRIAEGAGEDPWLNSVMAAAYVRGYQRGDLSADNTILACAKHYVAYGGAVGGRDYNTVDISERTLREIYLPPFKAAIDAGAGSVMSAFNDLNGVPATANHFTLTEILRNEWGFRGFVIGDYDAVEQLVDHRVAADTAEAVRQAILAGVDVDMGDVYQQHLLEILEQGKINESSIDQAVRRVLRMKFALGLFEKPYVDAEKASEAILQRESLELAREAARESIVLLKNESNLLPLSKDMGSVAIIGPLGNNRGDLLGTWRGEGKSGDVVTLLEGIRSKVSRDTRVIYRRGCGFMNDSTGGIEEAVNAVEQADAAILALGESANMNGEAGSRAFLDLPGVQGRLLKEVYATGTPTVLVLMSGRPLAISWSAEHVPAILATWAGGIQAGNAIADVLFGDYNPGGKLPVTFPRTVGQVPIYYNHKNTGRPPTGEKFTSKYIDVEWTPLYPFGYGLSYTEFGYDRIRVEPVSGEINRFRVIANVTNSGVRAGDEVVQLYIGRESASVSPPVKELKGFRRVYLEPGETARVTFALTPYHLSHIGPSLKRVVEPGVCNIRIGGNSRDVISTQITLHERQLVGETPPVDSRR